jgi:ribosomal protein L11 methylase PrmA
MRERKIILRIRFLVLLFVVAAVGLPEAAAQSVAEVARESRKKKEQSTRKVWTNDELGSWFPEIKLLHESSDPSWLSGYEATPYEVVDAMLTLVDVQPREVVFDLGAGDGRIVIMAAAKYGARGVGIELNSLLVEKSREEVAARGLEEQVKILHADILDVDLSPADVVTLYLPASGLEQVRPHMESTLRPGTRVVSHQNEIQGWTPEKVWPVDRRTLYLYRVP